MAEQKAHMPSERKLTKARKEGKVLKSQLLTQSTSIIAAFLSLYILHERFIEHFLYFLESCWLQAAGRSCTSEGVHLFMYITASVCFVVFATSLFMEFLQVGCKADFSQPLPQLKRINIFTGLRNVFSNLKNVWHIMLKLALLLLLVTVVASFAPFVVMRHFTLDKGMLFQGIFSYSIFYLAILLLLFLLTGVFDYLLKYKRFYAELSMSEQELRDEFKEIEGDPYVKGQRKSLHEELLMEDIVKRVRKARVIIVERESKGGSV